MPRCRLQFADRSAILATYSAAPIQDRGGLALLV
jgi:hypothetical protein